MQSDNLIEVFRTTRWDNTVNVKESLLEKEEVRWLQRGYPFIVSDDGRYLIFLAGGALNADEVCQLAGVPKCSLLLLKEALPSQCRQAAGMPVNVWQFSSVTRDKIQDNWLPTKMTPFPASPNEYYVQEILNLADDGAFWITEDNHIVWSRNLLCGWVFHYRQFQNLTFNNVNLYLCDLTGSQFFKCQFATTQFRAVNGFETRFVDCNFRAAKLDEVAFNYAILLSCDLRNVRFADKVSFQYAGLDSCIFGDNVVLAENPFDFFKTTMYNCRHCHAVTEQNTWVMVLEMPHPEYDDVSEMQVFSQTDNAVLQNTLLNFVQNILLNRKRSQHES